MTVPATRILASVLFVGGGLIVGVFALAIVVAGILAGAGMAIRPADAALLADLESMLVFIIAFAGLNLLAAVGLVGAKSWAGTLAVGTAGVAVGIGATGLVLILVGGDPSRLASGTTVSGITLLAAFTVLYVAAITALSVTRLPGRASSIGGTA